MPRVQADVAVAYSLPDDAPAVAASRQRGLPVVAIDGPDAAGAALVRSADRAGAEAAARYVTSLGHRRIGILMTPGVTASPGGPLAARDVASSRYRVDRERMTGYLDALREAGISEQGLPVWEAAGVSQYDAGPTARALLTAHPEVTALLCTSDELAIGALEAARALGIAVPQALSIVGYDDTPGARHANPPLTTVHQDLIAKGTLAARLARDVLAGRSPAAPEPVGVELVVRGTTAPPVER
jgi:DNA-binding LacI/PurR family transcriptional regulator